MKNSMLKEEAQKDDPQKDALKATPVLHRQDGARRFENPIALAKRFLVSLRAWTDSLFHQPNKLESSTDESISSEDKVAILKTQCDYVRSCYRVKLLERQRSAENVPQSLDTEMDELLDSYQRLKRAYEELEHHDH